MIRLMIVLSTMMQVSHAAICNANLHTLLSLPSAGFFGKRLTKVMKTIIVIALLTISTVCAANPNSRIQQHDAFGPGKHQDQFGRPVIIKPVAPSQHVIPNSRIQQRDAFGPGKHQDQFGRIVTVAPAR